MPKHSSSKQKSSKQDGGGGSQWSAWVWSKEHSRYYCYRTKRNGEIEYHWQEQAIAEPQDAATPRQQADVGQLAEEMDNLSMSPGTTDSYDYSYASGAGTSDGPTYAQEATSRSKSSRSGKGKAVAYSEPQDAQPDPQPIEPMPLDPFYGANSGQADQATQNLGPLTSDDPYSGQPNPYSYDQPTYEATGTSTDYSNEPAQGSYDYSTAGESSTDQAYVSYVQDEPNPGLSTPTTAADEPLHIVGTAGDHEELDPRYRIERSNKFQPGQIFKILWPEPFGGNQNHHGAPTMESIRGPYGQQFYCGIRRFVVVANDDGNCACVPILTYGGKGCRKNGVKSRAHGIIYGGRKAHKVPGEPELGFKEVKAKLIEGETLQRESRINYAKICTIEHNVKVFFIGHIVKEDVRAFKKAVDTCWEMKKHEQPVQYGY